MPEHKIVIYANGFGQSKDRNFTPFSNVDDDGDPLAPFRQRSQAKRDWADSKREQEETGVAALAKISPYVAIAIAAVKVSSSVAGVVSSVLSDYAGDYRFSVAFNNWKSTISNVFNPIGLAVNYTKRVFDFKKNEQSLQQQRTLIGRTAINNGKLGV